MLLSRRAAQRGATTTTRRAPLVATHTAATTLLLLLLSTSACVCRAFAPTSTLPSPVFGGGVRILTTTRPGIIVPSVQKSAAYPPHRPTHSVVVAASTLKDAGDAATKAGKDDDDDDDGGRQEEEEEVEASSDLDVPTVVAADDADTADAEGILEVKPNGETTSLHDDDADADADAGLDLGLPIEGEEEDDEESKRDAEMMRIAIQHAQSRGGERGARSPFPKPIVGAVIVTKDGRVIGRGRASYKKDAVRAAIADAGIVATPLREWCVQWPSDTKLRQDISESTLYVTLEPSTERQGTSLPPLTQLIEVSGIARVVIGCADPIPQLASEGAATLHAAGLSVTMGVEQEECENLISEYTSLALSKLHRMARGHFKRTGRPLGFLHCSVIDSDDAEAFARNGNAFGNQIGGQILSFRDFGSYALAPPPESIWAGEGADDEDDEFSTEIDDIFSMDFEEEDWQESLNKNPMMPWYEQVDACVATFPRKGNGPANDNTVTARLFGLKWLANQGEALPAAVERILVMDATDLDDLPMSNDNPNLPDGMDIEAFWNGQGRRPARVLLRHGDNAQAIAAAESAAKAAALAAEAALTAKEAIESGDAEKAAEAAIECQRAAMAASEIVQSEMQKTQDLKQKLTDMGVVVEVIKGGEPLDVMNHLGERNGYKAVVWRAGCWGERGVQSILAGAFQWVSAHLAVDAVGGKFWQLMLAERAVQAACGPERKVKIFSDQEDISLEYCDDKDADQDCNLTVDGQPVRHVRLDCRVMLEDENRRCEVISPRTKPMNEQYIKEEAPWFL